MTRIPAHLRSLHDICTASETRIARRFGATRVDRTAGQAHRPYWFRDNGASVLYVAHLDIVGRDPRARFALDTAAGDAVHSRALDDRLGVWCLEQLQARGQSVDILFTTDEEKGASTASFFTPDTDYDFIVQMDRHGHDTVLYEYDTPALRGLVKQAGGSIGNGSFSDICYLTHLGVSGINFATAYWDEHTPRCMAYLDDVQDCIDTVDTFLDLNRGIRLPYVPQPFTSASAGWAGIPKAAGPAASGLDWPSTDREADWSDELREIHGLTDADFSAWMAHHA